jgi:hypothetical protein
MLIWAIALLVLMSLYVTLRFPLGIAGEWLTYYHVDRVAPGGIIVFGASLVAFLGLAWFFDGAAAHVSRAARGALVVVLTAVFLLALSNSVRCGPYGNVEFAAPAFESNGIGLFSYEAARIKDPKEYLRDFPARLSDYSLDYRKTVRVNNNPPGATILFYGATTLAESGSPLVDIAEGAVFGSGFQAPTTMHGATVLGAWFVMIGSALAFIPAYLLAGALAGRPAPFVAAVALLAGSLFLFNPGNDNLNVLFFLTATWLTVRGARARPLWWGVSTGVVLAATFFFTLAAAVLIVVLLFMSSLHVVRSGRHALRGAIIFWGGVLSGVLAGFAALYLATGYNSFASLLACYRNHALFYNYFPRSYWLWVPYNLAEFAIFLGGPLVACVLAAVSMPKALRDGAALSPIARAMMLSGIVVLVGLDVSGKNLSEVNRLWAFFMPLMTIPACAILAGTIGRSALLAAALLQAFYLVLLRVPLDVWRSQDFITEIQRCTGQ